MLGSPTKKDPEVATRRIQTNYLQEGIDNGAVGKGTINVDDSHYCC
jgi:hypothetical protein